MRILLQRVAEASVVVESRTIAEIGPGLLALVGAFPNDGMAEVDWLVDKTLGLRIFHGTNGDSSAAGGLFLRRRRRAVLGQAKGFPDEREPMNRSVLDVGGAILVVSQFTLAADLSRGKRPSFGSAAPADQAERLVDAYAAGLKASCADVQTGRFGANMRVALINDGPATFLLER